MTDDPSDGKKKILDTYVELIGHGLKRPEIAAAPMTRF